MQKTNSFDNKLEDNFKIINYFLNQTNEKQRPANGLR